MKQFVVAFIICVGMVSNSYGREFVATGTGYGYSFSDVKGWLGVGKEPKKFSHADMVFFPAEVKGPRVIIHHEFTDLNMYTNVTSGTVEKFLNMIETVYKKGSPNLKVVHARKVRISRKLYAKVTYIFNITSENKAQAIGSIQSKGVIVSLIMQAKSDKLLKQNLQDFTKLLKTYKEIEK